MSGPYLSVDRPDAVTAGVFLEAPASCIVLLQAFIESHESLGAVRTLDREQNVICIVTTSDMLNVLFPLLTSIRAVCPWREARTVDKVLLEQYRINLPRRR